MVISMAPDLNNRGVELCAAYKFHAAAYKFYAAAYKNIRTSPKHNFQSIGL